MAAEKRFILYLFVFLLAVFLTIYIFKKGMEKKGDLSDRAMKYSFEGKLNKAIEAETKAIMLSPKTPENYVRRGGFYLEAGKYQKAINDYDTALRLIPGSFPYRNLMEARLAYDKVTKQAMIYINRGKAKLRLNEHEEAIKDFNNALLLKAEPKEELSPEAGETVRKLEEEFLGGIRKLAIFERGLAHEKLGNYEKALSDIETAAKLGLVEAQLYLERKVIRD